jgi:alpha-tubulin suppressor-like RCC1 family protein
MIVQTATGEIWGWGDNANGVLGNALFERTGTNVTNPTKISLPNAYLSEDDAFRGGDMALGHFRLEH